MDIRGYTEGGQDIFVKMAASELGEYNYLQLYYLSIYFVVFLLCVCGVKYGYFWLQRQAEGPEWRG